MSEPFIPYGRQTIDDDDIRSVEQVLRGDWLTTGPMVGQFEEAFAAYVDAPHAVAVSSGTAALHLAMIAAGVGEGDEVIVPAMTFVASANCALYVGARVAFADIDEATFTIDVESARALVTPRTKAIVVVDYAGLPCDLGPLRKLADEHGLTLIEDACHAPGATYKGAKVGSIADFTAFSFHPVKHLTTGEGGMITTRRAEDDARLRTLRNHGIATDFRGREEAGTWEYDQVELGFNYRLPDINCALGLSQLSKLDGWIERRREIADRYLELLGDRTDVALQQVPAGFEPAWHLYPVRLLGPDSSAMRKAAFSHMRSQGIGVNVHYRPIYQHQYYRDLGYDSVECPVAERVYDGLLSLPMWPGLDNAGQDRVVRSLIEVLEGYTPR